MLPFLSMETKELSLCRTTTFSSPLLSWSSTTWPAGVWMTRPVGGALSASGGTVPVGYQVPTQSG